MKLKKTGKTGAKVEQQFTILYKCKIRIENVKKVQKEKQKQSVNDERRSNFSVDGIIHGRVWPERKTHILFKK